MVVSLLLYPQLLLLLGRSLQWALCLTSSFLGFALFRGLSHTWFHMQRCEKDKPMLPKFRKTEKIDPLTSRVSATITIQVISHAKVLSLSCFCFIDSEGKIASCLFLLISGVSPGLAFSGLGMHHYWICVCFHITFHTMCLHSQSGIKTPVPHFVPT